MMGAPRPALWRCDVVVAWDASPRDHGRELVPTSEVIARAYGRTRAEAEDRAAQTAEAVSGADIYARTDYALAATPVRLDRVRCPECARDRHPDDVVVDDWGGLCADDDGVDCQWGVLCRSCWADLNGDGAEDGQPDAAAEALAYVRDEMAQTMDDRKGAA